MKNCHLPCSFKPVETNGHSGTQNATIKGSANGGGTGVQINHAGRSIGANTGAAVSAWTATKLSIVFGEKCCSPSPARCAGWRRLSRRLHSVSGKLARPAYACSYGRDLTSFRYLRPWHQGGLPGAHQHENWEEVSSATELKPRKHYRNRIGVDKQIW